MEIQNLETTKKPVVLPGNSAENQSFNTAKIEEWLVSYLADLLEMDKDEVDVTVPFERYGLDSASALGLIGDLEEWLGYNLDPTLLYNYPTIERLGKYLSTTLNT
ncbi:MULTISPECIES: acyl carrier protein [unclassified Microcoleus]|uniref:acyl carrier protein n=1 Tax=unclassified Microcoleus TaxID=2642155 RepID=UPI002FCEC638